jgi:hypothetical protein
MMAVAAAQDEPSANRQEPRWRATSSAWATISWAGAASPGYTSVRAGLQQRGAGTVADQLAFDGRLARGFCGPGGHQSGTW